MNSRKMITACFAAVCMTALILDSRTGIGAMGDGIEICIRTLIPSLFPFFVFSSLLTNALAGKKIKVLRPAAKLCRIPEGCESLFAASFLGGYPVGARNVAAAWEQGGLSDEDARRMVVFCSNSGPAFIFGFLGPFFRDSRYPWLLFLIHVLSAILTGILLPGGNGQAAMPAKRDDLSFCGALERSIPVMARVCGWVLLFRVFLEFLRRWLFWLLPSGVQILLAGMLELSNGCLALKGQGSDGAILVLGSAMLGFGGFCVYLQTCSVVGKVSMRLYLPGKLMQACISFLLSYLVQRLFMADRSFRLSPFLLAALPVMILLIFLFLRKTEKPVAISKNLLYNLKSYKKERGTCSSGRKLKNPVLIASMARN